MGNKRSEKMKVEAKLYFIITKTTFSQNYLFQISFQFVDFIISSFKNFENFIGFFINTEYFESQISLFIFFLCG